MRILVLDDEPWSVSWIRDFVKPLGGEVELVETFDQAVSACKNGVPDIAVIDVMIGQSSVPFQGATLANAEEQWQGLKFLRHLRVELRASKKTTEIIVYSVLDRGDLADLVVRAYQGHFRTKGDVSQFRKLLGSLLREKTS